MRSAAHPCPVAACGNLRDRWAAVCRSCWRRLPEDLRRRIKQARAAKAAHRVAAAEMAAVAWLNAHPVSEAIARACGDHDPPAAPS
jgi:hypothetical protein